MVLTVAEPVFNRVPGVDPVLFLRGGVPLRNGITDWCEVEGRSSRGRVAGAHTPYTLPLDPPPSVINPNQCNQSSQSQIIQTSQNLN